MRLFYSANFKNQVELLTKEEKNALKSKLHIFIQNPRHPSLRSKKIQGQKNIFESSITKSLRMTWQYVSKGILLRNIGEHDKTLKKP